MKADDSNPVSIDSLVLPMMFDESTYQTALEIDDFLKQDKPLDDELNTKVTSHQETALTHLLRLYPQPIFDINFDWFSWPISLYIPKNANSSNYWPGPAPDDHRYGLAWISPSTATANRASYYDGTLFSFSQLNNQNVRKAQTSESGIGIFYKPSMSLGVIDFQPQLNCTGILRTFLQFFPMRAAGYVEIKAHLLLAAWHQIPNGFDLIGFKQFDVATSGQRDQSFGPELRDFQRSFRDTDLSLPLVVQRGYTYLFGVVSRISIISTLTDTQGRPLPPIDNTKFRVWGSINCTVPQINVLTKQVYIP